MVKLTCHVRRVRLKGGVWQWFFTDPLVYSVLRVYDRAMSDSEFLEQQVALARAHREASC